MTAEAPLLDTTTASGGRVIDKKQIVDLPFSDMNPFALTGSPRACSGPASPNTGARSTTAARRRSTPAGGVGQNEYSIDGMPVTGTGRRVGFTPPSDAVQEFKLRDRDLRRLRTGHTSGAVVNVMTQLRHQQLHGSLFDQHWQQRWNATPHFTRNSWEQDVASGKITQDTPKQAPGRSNHFGGDIGGPICIPRSSTARTRRSSSSATTASTRRRPKPPSSINRTVPKTAWKTATSPTCWPSTPAKYQIYDPRSAKRADGTRGREPVPGQQGHPDSEPDVQVLRRSSIRSRTTVPGRVSRRRNNYYARQMPKDEKFNSILNRYDYNVSEKQRLYGTLVLEPPPGRRVRLDVRDHARPARNGLTRINKGGGGDWI